jgi:hypothetical protein
MTDSGEKKRARPTSPEIKDEGWISFEMIVTNIEMIDALVLEDVTSSRVSVDVLVEGTRYLAIRDLKRRHAHELMLAFAAAKGRNATHIGTFQHLVDLITREKLCLVPEESSESDTN